VQRSKAYMVQHTVLAIAYNNMRLTYHRGASIGRVTEPITILGFVCTPDHDNLDNCKSPGIPDVTGSSTSATTGALSKRYDTTFLEFAMLI
jgi:hypothetical protein